MLPDFNQASHVLLSLSQFVLHCHYFLTKFDVVQTMELQHWWHWQHPLVFNKDERSGRPCNGCSEPVFDPSYNCKECRGWYIHHKSCAELPLGCTIPHTQIILLFSSAYINIIATKKNIADLANATFAEKRVMNTVIVVTVATSTFT